MALKITEEMKAKAELYYGDELGQEKTKHLLKEVGLPTGLLPLKNIIECGYIEETGFTWVKQKEKIEHKFEKVGKLTSYGVDVQAYVEKEKIKKLVGVKVKELIWLTLCEISLDKDKIKCKTPSGIYKTFPAAAFELEEINKPKEVEESEEVEEMEESN